MHKQQPLEIMELPDGNIGVVYSLPPLAASDPDANMRCLDHGHIVRTVSDGQRHRLGVFQAALRQLNVVSHEGHHLCLLQRRDPAGDHDAARRGDVHEELLQVRGRIHDDRECGAGHDQGRGKLVQLRAPGSPIRRARHLQNRLELRELVTRLPELCPQLFQPLLQRRVRHCLLGLRASRTQTHVLHVQRLLNHVVRADPEHFCAAPDVARRLELVPRQHPELDARFADVLDGVWDPLLELVLDCRGSDNAQVLLDQLSDVGHCFLVILQLSFPVLVHPIVVDLFRELLPADHQGAEPLLGELLQLLLQLRLVPGRPLRVEHHVVRTLHQEEILAFVLHHNRHALPRGVELVLRLVLVRLDGAVAPLDLHRGPRAPLEGPAHLRSCLHQRFFVGALSLVLLGGPASFCLGGDDRVAHTQDLPEPVDNGLVLSVALRQPLVNSELHLEEPDLAELSERRPQDGGPLELHDVLRERASLV
mmetsp:Transcript_51619/g.136348  ORF Transcript_51619/g.136348 Transcript_51619/m.136348 type:complete len:478 (+) Transcript_51619:1954-3387(+)